MQKPPTNAKKLSITDGQTNRQTDQLTVIASYRDAYTRLKNKSWFDGFLASLAIWGRLDRFWKTPRGPPPSFFPNFIIYFQISSKRDQSEVFWSIRLEVMRKTRSFMQNMESSNNLYHSSNLDKS